MIFKAAEHVSFMIYIHRVYNTYHVWALCRAPWGPVAAPTTLPYTYMDTATRGSCEARALCRVCHSSDNLDFSYSGLNALTDVSYRGLIYVFGHVVPLAQIYTIYIEDLIICTT